MAGDWIRMRSSLCTHPKVLAIAEIIGGCTAVGKRLSTGFNGCLDEIVTRDVTRDVTLASLFRVWCNANEHTTDGVWHSSTLRTIDSVACVPGFGEAMAAVGWAVVDEEAHTVTFPHFLEFNAPAKGNQRSSAAERQKRYREKMAAEARKSSAATHKSDASRGHNGDVTRDITRDVTTVTREEKRREEEEREEPLPTASGDFHLTKHRETGSNPRAKGTNPRAKGTNPRALDMPKPDDVADQVWSDFLRLRHKKHAPATETALDGIRAEAGKAGISLEAALATCCAKGWQGFDATWYAKLGASERQRGGGQVRLAGGFVA